MLSTLFLCQAHSPCLRALLLQSLGLQNSGSKGNGCYLGLQAFQTQQSSEPTNMFPKEFDVNGDCALSPVLTESSHADHVPLPQICQILQDYFVKFCMSNACASKGCFWHAVLFSCRQKLVMLYSSSVEFCMTITCASRGCFWHAVLLSCRQKLSEPCDGHLGIHQLTDQLRQLEQGHPQNLHHTPIIRHGMSSSN